MNYFFKCRISIYFIFAYLYTCAREIENADEKWFVWQPENTMEEGIIGMSDWLDAPSGKHGWLTIKGNEDGTPIKAWGVNHSNNGCGLDKEEADLRAQWYAKMGISIKPYGMRSTNK